MNARSSFRHDIHSSNSFKALKAICVPLLGNSLLTQGNIPQTSNLLSQLEDFLKALQEANAGITPANIEYAFFPILQIIRRNPMATIPDSILEKLMSIIDVLFEDWWWSCEIEIWEQMLILSSAVFCGIDSSTDAKGKRRERAEGTKRAAAQCLCTLLRLKTGDIMSSQGRTPSFADERYRTFKARSQLSKLLPVLGQTLTALMDTCLSLNRSLQRTSLELMLLLISSYFPDGFLPSILPGVVSAMIKVALGKRESKGWSPGETVSQALVVMQAIIIGAIRDEVCEKEGALRVVTTLEDLANAFEVNGQSKIVTSTSPGPFFTTRTSAWLSANASQLNIALNTLLPLLRHPNPVVLLAITDFSYALLCETSQTLPDSQPLLLSFLLSLSTVPYPNIADAARSHLLELLSAPSKARFTLLNILSRIVLDSLNSLPRLVPSHNDLKVAHLAGQVSAACKLADSVPAVSEGIGHLLGPSGGIERWGWNLLSVLNFHIPRLFISAVQPSEALLEGGPESANLHPFPEVNMKHISSRDTRQALDDMFRALGHAAGADALFATEWFIGVGRGGRSSKEISALWCSSKLLEGIASVSLDNVDFVPLDISKRIEKTARYIANVVSELWDQEDEEKTTRPPDNMEVDTPDSDRLLPLEYVKGLDPLVVPFDFTKDNKQSETTAETDTALHTVLSLHLLSISAAILRSRFMRLLLDVFYPILQSLVSENNYVSATALATLHYITSAMGYASPSNLLLANFDYALDGVSRRLDRRRLDPEATKVLVVLVRLVGKDIVSRAGDVVEACFDRLDEFHGYTVLVEGLVEVLFEVIKVVEVDHRTSSSDNSSGPKGKKEEPLDPMQSFLEWYRSRNESMDATGEHYGPAPREDWANLSKGKQKDDGEDTNAEELTETPLTPIQALTKQIISHSIYFLTHGSPLIRVRILGLFESAVPTLTESALLPVIHSAWPYILNRLDDPEPYVTTAAVSLIESLCTYVGDFMASRVWKDVWPRFQKILTKLEKVDSQSALARRGWGAVGTKSAYSQSHRFYRSLLRTMRSVAKGATLRQDVLWDVALSFRRFLHSQAHPELQQCARDLYDALSLENVDVVWLVLSGTIGRDIVGQSESDLGPVSFLREPQWDIQANVQLILNEN